MRSTFFLVAMFILASLQASSVTMRAQANNPFVGTWKLISIETRGPDGAIAPGPNPVGGVNPTGTVMYDAAGNARSKSCPADVPPR